MPQNYRPGLDVVRLAALLPVLCYHYCIEAARLGFAVPTALIGRGMADWVEVGLAWFFLLSGAALCLQWQGRFDARRYFVGRAAATYPAFWLGFGALFLYGEVLHGNNADIPRWRVIFSVLGLDGYLAPVTVTFYKIGEWFLGVILILYLVFPLLLRCMETAAHRRVLALCMAVLAVVWPLICPAPWEVGHTVLGRLPAFALGVWFGTLLKKNALPSYRLYIGLAVCPLLWVDEVPRLAVLLVLASVLFWAVYAAGQHVPAPLCPALRRLAGWCYGVYLVHHVLLTLVFLPFVQGHGLPLAGMFPVYLAASFVPAAVLTALNLADDLMEPFRPVADLYVAANVAEDAALTPILKGKLVNLLNADILSGGQHHSVAYAMERLVQGLRGQALLLPKLLEYKQHSYE